MRENKGTEWKGLTCDSTSKTGSVTCAHDELDYFTLYIWEATATDDGNASATEEWSFKTRKNLPPYPPITMSHCDKNAEEIEAKDWREGITLTWERPNVADYTEHKLYKGVSCEANPVNPDCESDQVTYLVYFQGSVITCGTGSPENSCIITPDKLGYGEKYSWQVFPTDEYNGEESARNNAGDFCNFETSDDQKPEPATDPFVNDIDNNIALQGINDAEIVTLKATGKGDPDGHAVTYEMLYGKYVDGAKDDKWNPVNNGNGTNTPNSYNIYRIQGSNVFYDANKNFLGGEPIAEGVTETHYTDENFEADDKDKRFYYLVKGYYEGIYSYESNPTNGNNVGDFGTLKMVIAPISVPEGVTESVPITIPNPGDLRIATANICIGYDASVIKFAGQLKFDEMNENNLFHSNQQYQMTVVQEYDASGLSISGVTKIVQIKTSFDDPLTDPEDVETILPPIKGVHPPIFEIPFEATNAGDSILKFINSSVETLNNADLQACSNLNAEFGTREIINFVDNNLRVTKRGTRDGSASNTARFYVRDTYQLGDVNGNGIIDAGDFRNVAQIQGKNKVEVGNSDGWLQMWSRKRMK